MLQSGEGDAAPMFEPQPTPNAGAPSTMVMIESLRMIRHLTPEALDWMLRAWDQHKRSTMRAVGHGNELLLPMLHEMVVSLEAQPPETVADSTKDGKEPRTYPHGELSFGEGYDDQASKYPGQRCLMIAFDQAAVFSLQQCGAERTNVSVHAFRLAEVTGASTKNGYKQHGCGNPDTKEQTKATVWSVGPDGEGGLVSMAGGYPGSPQELSKQMHDSKTPQPMRELYLTSTIVYLPNGWNGLSELIDGNGDPPPLEICEPALHPGDEIVTEQVRQRDFGLTGPWHAPLFIGGSVYVRIASMHKVFKIKDYAHWLCLIALFGGMWFSFSSAAPQSASCDTGVQIDRHGLVVATGSKGGETTSAAWATPPALRDVAQTALVKAGTEGLKQGNATTSAAHATPAAQRSDQQAAIVEACKRSSATGGRNKRLDPNADTVTAAQVARQAENDALQIKHVEEAKRLEANLSGSNGWAEQRRTALTMKAELEGNGKGRALLKQKVLAQLGGGCDGSQWNRDVKFLKKWKSTFEGLDIVISLPDSDPKPSKARQSKRQRPEE